MCRLLSVVALPGHDHPPRQSPHSAPVGLQVKPGRLQDAISMCPRRRSTNLRPSVQLGPGTTRASGHMPTMQTSVAHLHDTAADPPACPANRSKPPSRRSCTPQLRSTQSILQVTPPNRAAAGTWPGRRRDARSPPARPRRKRVGAHNSVVGADQGFRAPSWDQESVRDSGHENSASAPIAAGQRPRQSFRRP